MKIIEIATGYTPIPAKIGAATEIVIENLIYGFNNAGIENELIDITFSDNSKSKTSGIATIIHYQKLPNWLNKVDDNSFVHYLRRIIYSIRVGIFIKSYLKNQEDKIVLHFHNQFNFFFAYLISKKMIKEKKVRTLYTVHSPGWSIFSKIPKRLILEKYAIRKADFVISLTHVIQQKIIRLAGINQDNRILVIPNGVSTGVYKPIPDIKKENSILNVGSICERKNQLETIKILKTFLRENSFKFLFAGKIIEPDYFEKIKKYIHENNLEQYITYIGEVEPGKKLNQLYNSSKFYISNSKQEAFSLVILESMSAGLPVILSETFESFIDKSELLRDVVIISRDDNIIIELKKLLTSQGAYDSYREKQIDCLHNNYDWNMIANQIIHKITF